jgi:hypothetical protein
MAATAREDEVVEGRVDGSAEEADEDEESRAATADRFYHT